MPGKLKVKILAGRNLPVMDRSGDTTDAYVELKFSNITYKTDVCRKSLNPQWNSEWYKFEVDDAELQDEPLQIRLMDHDTYSANDAIGKVYLNLNPLLLPVRATKNLNNTENSLGNVPAQGSLTSNSKMKKFSNRLKFVKNYFSFCFRICYDGMDPSLRYNARYSRRGEPDSQSRTVYRFQ